MSLLLNMLSRLVIIFLPRSKCLLISWLQSPSAVMLEPPNLKSYTVSTVSPFISIQVMGPFAMILVSWMLSFKPAFPSPLSFSSRGCFVPLCFFHKGGVICISETIDISPDNIYWLHITIKWSTGMTYWNISHGFLISWPYIVSVSQVLKSSLSWNNWSLIIISAILNAQEFSP